MGLIEYLRKRGKSIFFVFIAFLFIFVVSWLSDTLLAGVFISVVIMIFYFDLRINLMKLNKSVEIVNREWIDIVHDIINNYEVVKEEKPVKYVPFDYDNPLGVPVKPEDIKERKVDSILRMVRKN